MLSSGTLPPFLELYVMYLDFNCFSDEHTYFTVCKGAQIIEPSQRHNLIGALSI